jgi:hypothetical protein
LSSSLSQWCSSLVQQKGTSTRRGISASLLPGQVIRRI